MPSKEQHGGMGETTVIEQVLGCLLRQGAASKGPLLAATATQHLVKSHQVGETGQPGSDQVLLGIVRGTLKNEHRQIIVDPLFIADPGKPVTCGNSICQGLLRRYLGIDGPPLSQGVGHLPEGSLDCFLVLGYGDFPVILDR